ELETAAQSCGVTLAVVAEVDSIPALKDLVSNGFGLTILPKGALLSELQNPCFAARRLTNPDITMKLLLADSLNGPVTTAMLALARAVRAEVESALSEGRL